MIPELVSGLREGMPNRGTCPSTCLSIHSVSMVTLPIRSMETSGHIDVVALS